MSQPAAQFTLRIEQDEGFAFRTRFDKEQFAELRTDEPAPLGHDSAPNPVRLLAAAVGNCLAASLLFCLSKAGATPKNLSADVTVTLVRNEDKKLRVGGIDVSLHPEFAQAVDIKHCLEIFEDFCVVTQSVREGLDVKVRVLEKGPAAKPEAHVAS